MLVAKSLKIEYCSHKLHLPSQIYLFHVVDFRLCYFEKDILSVLSHTCITYMMKTVNCLGRKVEKEFADMNPFPKC